jgi:ABC-type transport system involved in multi-copper enzyme maturation permease subunit
MAEAAETPPVKKVRTKRLLPYLAVFQADLHQTLRSWVYRTWVLLSAVVAFGYLLYRFGAYQEAGFYPSTSHLIGDLLRWSLVGSVTLIIILTAGSISAERGTLADSVLSRGISRYQFFLGKWHSRLTIVVMTFIILGALVLGGSIFLLRDETISLTGCLVALGTVAALLTVVVTCGVTVSALSNSTLLGIAVVWLVLYGGGFVLSVMPASWPSPDRALAGLPDTLLGLYDLQATGRLVAGALAASLGVALVGVVGFSRRDV